jgi:catalase
MHYPGNGALNSKRVAILVADGVEADGVVALYDAVLKSGGVPRVISVRLGKVESMKDIALDAEATLENSPSVLFDAMVIAAGSKSVDRLSKTGQTLEFLRDQYRHCKPIMIVGEADALLKKADISQKLPDGEFDPSLIVVNDMPKGIATFIKALGGPRDFSRETDPPLV